MKIFCDFHHGGLARSLFYLFADRLGHELRFPDISFVDEFAPGGVWNRLHHDFPERIGGIDPATWAAKSGTISYEQFIATRWDAIIVSRPESQAVYDRLALPGDLLRIGVIGNENTVYDWTSVRLLISTDESSYHAAPVPKILTAQEIGRQYGATFIPPSESSLFRIHAYMNNMPGMSAATPPRMAWSDGHCPHCGALPQRQTPISALQLWQQAHTLLPSHTFFAYGHFNESVGGVNVQEVVLPSVYAAAALTWHIKSSEGYGHSVLQSIACGRPAIVPRGFFRYRTAGRFLIPGITCFEVELTPTAIAETIRRKTESFDVVYENALRCYETARALMNWSHEARRVSQWINANI